MHSCPGNTQADQHWPPKERQEETLNGVPASGLDRVWSQSIAQYPAHRTDCKDPDQDESIEKCGECASHGASSTDVLILD